MSVSVHGSVSGSRSGSGSVSRPSLPSGSPRSSTAEECCLSPAAPALSSRAGSASRRSPALRGPQLLPLLLLPFYSLLSPGISKWKTEFLWLLHTDNALAARKSTLGFASPTFVYFRRLFVSFFP